MKKQIAFAISLLFILSATAQSTDSILAYTVSPLRQSIGFYWKDEAGDPFKTIDRLKSALAAKKQTLVFAMNGGMYQADHSPLGLFVSNGKMLHTLNTKTGDGNFYLQPNGVLYITADKKAGICATNRYHQLHDVQFATQSGPMLIVDGQINSLFTPGSKNLNIRNGAGILPNGDILFAMSKLPVSFYNFAAFFRSRHCTYALYLDGFVSRTYLPQQHWEQTDGDFGVIIAETSR